MDFLRKFLLLFHHLIYHRYYNLILFNQIYFQHFVGFGDFVAGHFDSPWMWFYKIAVVLWIIFGLAYLSMILNFISQGLRSNRLSHVVHSIRLTGPHSIHGFKHGLRSVCLDKPCIKTSYNRSFSRNKTKIASGVKILIIILTTTEVFFLLLTHHRP